MPRTGRPRPLPVLLSVLAIASSLASSLHARPEPLRVTVEVDNSLGLRAGDAVTSGGERIGRVAEVGFGDEAVDVTLEIDPAHRDLVRRSSTFVISETATGSTIEHYVLDEKSPPAKPGSRLPGARSIAEIWLKRGRINSEELGQAMSRGMDALRRSIEELKRSEEWPKFRDQLARLAAQFTSLQGRMASLVEQELPKLQQQLDALYQEYQKELERQQGQPPRAATPDKRY